MDYEFRRNTLDGTVHCEFSMGHEALGRWLVDELGTDANELDEVITALTQVIAHGGEWQRKGNVFHLLINNEEAQIQANALYEENDEALSEDFLHFYDEESVSLCGPEDLLAVLMAWQDFLQRFGYR